MTIENVFVNGRLADITVENGHISKILYSKRCDTPRVIDPQGPQLWMAMPSMTNMHTHSAMTLLRSAGSGEPLFSWLQNAIFPREALLTAEDIYKGSKDACEEMLSSGTTAFNDMYFEIESTLRAASEKGFHGNVALSVIDRDFENGNVENFIKNYKRLTADYPTLSISLAPHSVYTVSPKNLQYAAELSHEYDTLFHIHISETLKEREDCIREYGVPPVVHLDKLGVFDKTGANFIGAHALWLDEDEIAILGKHRCNVVHCPNSNLKLGSGFRFLYTELRDAGVNVTLGTDGCASSDNLDMLEAAKTMSLLQKGIRNDPSVMPAEETFTVASANGRKALRLADNSIAEGNVADFYLVNLNTLPFKGVEIDGGDHHRIHTELLNRLLYAAHSDVIDVDRFNC